MSKVLLVETNEELSTKIRGWFMSEGCTVDVVQKRNRNLRSLRPSDYDLVILQNPESAVARVFYETLLGSGGPVPIVLIPMQGSINRKTVLDILGRQQSKRTEKMNDRTQVEAHAIAPSDSTTNSSPDILVAGNLLVDATARRVIQNNRDIDLTPLEFDLLEYMMRRPNAVITREHFNYSRQVSHQCASPEAFRTLMKTLRRKLGDSGKASAIVTVHGLGYRLRT